MERESIQRGSGNRKENALRSAVWLSFTVVCALIFIVLSHLERPWARRGAFAGGLLALLVLGTLGAMWPSIHTVAGLITLPCGVVFAVGLFRPHLMAQKWVVVYGSVAVVLAVVSVAFQAGYLDGR